MTFARGRLARWAAFGRLARRELVRHPWRTLLLVVLVAVPLAGLTLAVVAVRSATWTPDDARRALLGGADDVVDAAADGRSEAAFAAAVAPAYPPGSRLVAYRAAPDGLQTTGGHLRGVEVTDQPLDDRLLDGLVELIEGTGPRRTRDAAATPAVLDAAGAGLGDEVELLSGDVRITGVLVDPADRDRMLLVVRGERALPPGGELHAFVDAPRSFVGADRAMLDTAGASSAAPLGHAFDHLDGELRYRLLRTGVAGGLVLVLTAIVLAAGFAIAARQQVRSLGVLAASGIPPGGLQQVVLLQGVLTGLAGSLAGVAAGLSAAIAAPELVERLAGTVPRTLDVRPLDLLVVVLGGLIVPSVAAWLPARTARRAPVVAALAGRRPQGPLPLRMPLAAGVLATLGLVSLAFWARHQDTGWGYGFAATLATLFGGLALAPALVALAERLADRTRGAGRLAVRELGRHRLRSSAAVAALAAPASFMVFVATLARTDEVRREHESYERTVGADEVLLVDQGAPPGRLDAYGERLRHVLPGSTEVTADRLTSATGPPVLEARDVDGGGERRDILAVRPSALARLGAPERTVRALDRGAIVVFSPLPPSDDVRLVNVGPLAGSTTPPTPDLLVDRTTAVPRARGMAVVAPTTAMAWGLTHQPYALLVRAAAPLTDAQREAIDAVVTTRCDTLVDDGCDDEDLRASLLGSPTDHVWLEIGRDHAEAIATASASPLDAVGLSLLILAAASAAVLALTTTTLAPQRALLHAVGLSPAACSRVLAYHTLLVTSAAMALAIPGGLASAVAILSRPHSTGIGPQLPWGVIAALALAVPATSAAVVWSATAVTGRGPRDASSLSLDQQ